MNLQRRIVHSLLKRVESGHIELTETYPGGGSYEFGRRDRGFQTKVQIHDEGVYAELAKSKSIALGTSYAEGRWDADEVTGFLQTITRDLSRSDRFRRKLVPLLAPFQRIGTLPILNTRKGALENIARHYDMGNDMFELFLDRETMMYSSANYQYEGQSLEEAQRARLDRICVALELGPDDHLLEIGTGWGGMAIHAATRYGARVTTTTISQEQKDYAEDRVRAAGVEDLVTVLFEDYRDLEGSYDKLVSLEMIEAVGWEWFDTYFKKCSSLLKPDGLFFLQAICFDDSIYETEKRTRSFANTLIFPGGCLPSVTEIQKSVGKKTNLRMLELDDISHSYVLTLREWRERFEANATQIANLGYDEQFRRLWSFYFSMAEAGFAETRLRDVQIVFAKPHYDPPLGTVGKRRESPSKAEPRTARAS